MEGFGGEFCFPCMQPQPCSSGSDSEVDGDQCGIRPELCSGTSDSEDEENRPALDLHAGDSIDSETETDVDLRPTQLRFANFCNSRQRVQDIAGFDEADICELQESDTLQPQKTRKAYTSTVRNLGNKREDDKTLKTVSRRAHIIRSLQRGCGCGKNCLDGITPRKLLTLRTELHTLKRNEKRQVLITQAKAHYTRAKDEFKYFLDLKEVCATAYGNALFVSKKLLCEIRQVSARRTPIMFV